MKIHKSFKLFSFEQEHRDEATAGGGCGVKAGRVKMSKAEECS